LYFQLQLQKAPFLLCGVELWSRRWATLILQLP
jgi:hypothetical protein